MYWLKKLKLKLKTFSCNTRAKANYYKLFTKWLLLPLLIAGFYWFGQSYLVQFLGPTFGQLTTGVSIMIIAILGLWVWFKVTKKTDRQ